MSTISTTENQTENLSVILTETAAREIRTIIEREELDASKVCRASA